MRFYFCALLLLLTIDSTAQTCDIGLAQNYTFKYLSVNNGLSQNSITSILQDAKGFMWIGTYDGLNRFDGFTVQTKRHISNNSNSLSDNRVLCLYENKNGLILIGTDGGGINILDPKFDSISNINIKNTILPSNVIQAITADDANNIWAGSDKGLAIFNGAQGKQKTPTMFYPAEFRNRNVKSLMNDMEGNIWIGTDIGLFEYKPRGKWDAKNLLKIAGNDNIQVTAIFRDKHRNIWVGAANGLFKIDQTNTNLKPAGELLADITSMAQDMGGTLWISTKGDGLFKFGLDVHNNISSKDQYTTQKPFCNIADNGISAIYIDKSNTLWVGTYQKGINYTDLSTKNFYTFYPLMNNQSGVFGYKGKYISSEIETGNDLWVGTLNEGLYQYNKCTKQLTSYYADINSKSVCYILEARDKTIWIGGNNGLYKIEPGTSRRKIRTVKTGFVARSICEDNFGNLWIATWTGVYKYNPATDKFTNITTQNGISSNSVYVVYQDPYAPVIWAGTIGGGLNSIRYDANSYKITIYNHRENDRNSLSSNHVWCLYRDKSNALWVGTDAGLNKLTLNASATVTAYQTVNTPLLKDRKIMAILEDKSRNLWLSGSQGLFKFKIGNNSVRQYTYQNGLQSNTLTEAAYMNKEGLMYFGGINGLNYFMPGRIHSNPFKAITAFTDFRIVNKPVKIGEKIYGDVILNTDINYTKKIALSYKQKDFMIGFASLHYATPENNKFRYKLRGYDKNWIITDYTQRLAAYSNLDPGTYTFMVSSSNNDDFYQDEIKSIDFVIEPAPWATWWAKTIYLLATLSIITLMVNYFMTRHRLKNEIFKEKLEKEKVTELNEIKLNFFTNITHEIRTPLNLIISPLQDLLEVVSTYDHFTSMRLKIIHRNSFKLYSLINQILDLRKVSSDAEKLMVSEADLVQTLLDVKASFNWLAEQKNIRFDYRSPQIVNAWFDKDKIEKIIFNLISNAFKYTPDGGTISITLTINGEPDKQQACISIKDTGTGIDAAEQDKVFEMYYQSTAQYNQGTGIGLSLSKKLIEMHGGEIFVNSLVGEGSEFTIIFPISKNIFSGHNISAMRPETDNMYQVPADKELIVAEDKKVEIDLSKRSVLIIEDNEDQRAYFKDCLLPHFHVLDAANGQEGLDCAMKYQPDIIVTDLMMPLLDGMEVCRKIKSNVKTSHIPVIIHSVKNTTQSIKDALMAGADDFITKPFDYSMLTLKVNNILKSKNQLMLNIHKNDMISPAEVAIPSLDKELLKKIVCIVEKNIADANFSVEKLCDDIGMSRMNLHRRLHAIIGKTASEFIREVRIKRAGQLLATGSKRISEVMFEVGISSNSHFNRYFKEMYGKSPKEYIKQAGDLHEV